MISFLSLATVVQNMDIILIVLERNIKKSKQIKSRADERYLLFAKIVWLEQFFLEIKKVSTLLGNVDIILYPFICLQLLVRSYLVLCLYQFLWNFHIKDYVGLYCYEKCCCMRSKDEINKIENAFLWFTIHKNHRKGNPI